MFVQVAVLNLIRRDIGTAHTPVIDRAPMDDHTRNRLVLRACAKSAVIH